MDKFPQPQDLLKALKDLHQDPRVPRQADPEDPRPRFADLTEEDLAPWRDLPVSRLFLDDLKMRETEGLFKIYENVSMSDMESARINAGALNTVRSLLASFYPFDLPSSSVDDEFRDPASLLPKKGPLNGTDNE